MRQILFGLAFTSFIAGPAFAQSQNQTSAPAANSAAAPTAKKRPHKLICTDEESLGTRLGGHRVCRYSDDIANDRSLTRMQIERSQLQMNNSHGG